MGQFGPAVALGNLYIILVLVLLRSKSSATMRPIPCSIILY